MASDQSETSGSQVRQFGLYRSIDSRTEEFLRLSRKRQMRQGCACAAISTAITVTIIIIILLIYEYAIVVETSLVQRRKSLTDKSVSNNIPIADRLDRSYFDFDQDYYERMPLLINAMAENLAPELIMESVSARDLKPQQEIVRKTRGPSNIYSLARRTSPRPFQFERKNSTPFSYRKTYGSKNWAESYRNAQRMQNLQQIMVYLGKTFNAKLADIHTVPAQTHFAFSGIYIEPHNADPLPGKSQKTNMVQSRHRDDPLFVFKPDSPGDVNLLAEDYIKFSPTFIYNMEKSNYTISKHHNNGYNSHSLETFKSKKEILDDSINNDLIFLNKPDSFITNVGDVTNSKTTNDKFKNSIATSTRTLKKIYITTSRPIIQFKPRPVIPMRRLNIKPKPPHMFTDRTPQYKPNNKSVTESDTGAKMIVHVNVFPTKTVIKNGNTTTTTSVEQASITKTRKPYDEIPIVNASGVEDYHAGSSGVIPVAIQSQIVPQVTTITPPSDSTVPLPEQTWPTSPPEIMKFSREDAKIPEQYLTTEPLEDTMTTTVSTANVPIKSIDYNDVEARTLIIKLVNNLQTTTESIGGKPTNINTGTDHTTTSNTQVSQTNGHYRDVESTRKILIELLKESSEKYKRNRPKILMTVRTPTYVPMYVEIKRNRSKQYDETSD